MVLGQNLCDDGATSYVDNGIKDIKELVEKLQSQFSNIPIFINSVLPVESGYGQASKYIEGMKKANELLETYCSNTDNVTYIYSLEGFLDDNSEYAKQGLTSDKQHPNEEGAKILIDNIKQGIATNGETSGSSPTSSTINLVVATYKDVDGKITVSEQKINYQIETSKYATPTEFLIANLQTSNDPKYVKAIADMVIHNSNINYVIQDQYNETIVKNYESYTVNTYSTKKDNNGNLQSMSLKGSKNVKNLVSSKTTKTISILSYIKDADTWIVKLKQRYAKKISGPTTTTSSEQNLGDGSYDSSTGKKIVNRKKWTETTVYSVTYVPVLTYGNSSSTKFTGDIIKACEDVTQTFLSRGAHYSLDSGLISGDIAKSYNEAQAACCATYVSMVLYKSGVLTEEQINAYNYHWTGDGGVPDMLAAAGWRQVSPSEAQAGDVINKFGVHVLIYAGNGMCWDQTSCVVSSSGASPSGTTRSYDISNCQVWRAP